MLGRPHLPSATIVIQTGRRETPAGRRLSLAAVRPRDERRETNVERERESRRGRERQERKEGSTGTCPSRRFPHFRSCTLDIPLRERPSQLYPSPSPSHPAATAAVRPAHSHANFFFCCFFLFSFLLQSAKRTSITPASRFLTRRGNAAIEKARGEAFIKRSDELFCSRERDNARCAWRLPRELCESRPSVSLCICRCVEFLGG
jgi:hypothetical protein